MDPTPTYLVTDMVGYTPLIEELGDRKAQEVLRTHNQILRTCLQDHQGEELQHTGDGIIARFAAAQAAVACAVAMQRELRRHNQTPRIAPIRVRVGVALSGSIPATRICERADAEEILITDEVCRKLSSGAFTTRSVAKGEPIGLTLHAVGWVH